MTETKIIEEIARVVGEVYFINKDSKSELETLRKDFFILASEVAALAGTLAQKTVSVPDTITDPDEAEAYVNLYHTGWRIIDRKDDSFILEEDPDLIPYEVAVPVDGVVDIGGKEHPGYVIKRTVVSGSATLDDDRLKVDNRLLYHQVTQFRDWDTLKGLGVTWEQLSHVDWPRVPKNPDDLTPEQEAKVRPYTYESARSVRLNVRFAKEADL